MHHFKIKFIFLILTSLPLISTVAYGNNLNSEQKRPNILLITVDDMNWDSIGAFGSEVENATPNIDKLASSGTRFLHSHVTVAACWPSRAVWMTGLYPHRNGTTGFDIINPDVISLPEELKHGGYYTGLIGKNRHVVPSRKQTWDTLVETGDLGEGRDPKLYYEYSKQFLEQAKASSSPFFLMVNSHDPHRPFAGSKQERNTRKNNFIGRIASKLGIAEKLGIGKYPTPPEYKFSPSKVQVPNFLPDLPNVRLEIAEYYTSVHRADETVGHVLKALKEAKLDSSTLVIFLTDHGISMPYSKTNTYLHSTRAGMIVSWPKITKPGAVDNTNLVNGIDLMPTLLEAANLPITKNIDGHSFLSLLQNQTPLKRDHIFTYFYETSANKEYPMRAVQNKEYGYIFNAWSNGETVFKNEAQQGRTMKAMLDASENDEAIAKRVDFFLYRAPEEFYDYNNDPDALNNLIDKTEYANVIKEYREILLDHMRNTNDPALNQYQEFIKSL